MLATQKQWLTLSKNEDKIHGEIKITAPDIICSTILLDMMLLAKQRYPALKISLRGESPKIAFPVANNYVLSLAVDFYHPADLVSANNKFAQSGWEMLPIADADSFIFMNTANPLSKQLNISLEQFSAFKLVTYDTYTILPYSEIYVNVPQQNIIKLPVREAMFNLIAKDPEAMGIFSSFCSKHCSYIKEGVICMRALKDYPMPIKIVLIYPKDRKDDQLLTIIEELLLEASKT